jgi:hypothetical protein
MAIAVTYIGQTGQTTISGTTVSITTGSTAAGKLIGVIHAGNTNLRALSGITVDGVAASVDDSQVTSGQTQAIFSKDVSAGTHTVVLTYAVALNGGDHHYLWTYLVTGVGSKFAAAHSNSNASTFNFNTNKDTNGLMVASLFDGGTVNSVSSWTGVTQTASYVNPGSETTYNSVVGYQTPTTAGTGVNTPLVMASNFTARWIVVTYSLGAATVYTQAVDPTSVNVINQSTVTQKGRVVSVTTTTVDIVNQSMRPLYNRIVSVINSVVNIISQAASFHRGPRKVKIEPTNVEIKQAWHSPKPDIDKKRKRNNRWDKLVHWD